jgi:hypothetical protein
VFILKGVKVVCFDTLLQVLILKVDARQAESCIRGSRKGMPPPAFWGKMLQAIESKGRRLKKERQEILRGGKLLKDRGLEEERTNRLVRFARDNTAQHTTGLDVCQ